MSRDRFHGIWKLFGRKLKEQRGTRTDNPFAVAAATRDRLASRINEQRGISKKQEADRQLEDFMDRNRNWRNLPTR